MKKNKTKSQSISKSARKELAGKLTAAFNQVVSEYGKAKKADKAIGKLAKQLAKKISLSPKDDSIRPFIKEENEVEAVEAEKTDAVPVKKAVKKKA